MASNDMAKTRLTARSLLPLQYMLTVWNLTCPERKTRLASGVK